MVDNEAVLRAVLTGCATSIPAAQAAVREHFADDCLWEQSGFPATRGPEEAAQLLADLASSIRMERIDVEYLRVATAPDGAVFTERLDWLVQTDGTRLGSGRVVSVTEFRDGRIAVWREVFDVGGFSVGELKCLRTLRFLSDLGRSVLVVELDLTSLVDRLVAVDRVGVGPGVGAGAARGAAGRDRPVDRAAGPGPR